MGEVIPIHPIFDNTEDIETRGAVVRRPRSPNLYVDFRYFGHRVVLSTDLPDTPANHEVVRGFLDRVIAKRDAGTLVFAEAFPLAPDHKKSLFARLEGRKFCGKPDSITFGEYAMRWCASVLAQDPSVTKRHDHDRTLRSRILPYFEDMTLPEINGLVVKLFVLQLCHKEGGKKGQQLAGSTIRNTMSVFRVIWYDACEEFGWDLPDPFRYLARPNNRRVIPPRHHEAPQVFRYIEWSRFREAMETHYLPIVDLMVMTGMIASEIAALRQDDVQDGKILVRRSLTLGVEKESLKTDFRRREIPVTEEIGKRLAQAAPDAKGKYLFSMASGLPFDADNFRKNAWHRAMQRAGLPYRVPYATRHTFAAWSLTVGMHPERLVRLMGHSTKKMVYETYGKYVEGLESDGELILGYFGKDFK